jgi:hypothetical protein
LIADFDQNGKMDVFIVAGYGTYTPDSQNVGKAFMIEAGTGTCPEWLSFRRDAYRSGFLDRTITDSVCNPVTSSQSDIESDTEQRVYPNPCSNYLQIPEKEAAIVILRDLQGRIISTQNLGVEQQVNLESVPSGLYFLEVKTNGESRTHRVSVEK